MAHSLRWLAAALFTVAGPLCAQPNIVFCIADDASPTFGCYGSKWVNTPAIDAVAAKGLIFDNAYTPTAKCAPSRACILTGRHPWLLEEAGNHQAFFPHKFKAFSETLRESGVHVGAFGKVWGPGEAKHADGAPRDFALTDQGGKDPGAAFASFLKSRKEKQPFFFWFGSKNPHRPYKADAGVAAGKKVSDIDRVPKFWPDNETVRKDMLDYATEIEAYDSEVAVVLQVLKETGEEDNTIVIITSDHGMPFPRVKGHNYDMANHIPFIVKWPRVIAKERQGQHLADMVSFPDLAPTFLEVMGIEASQSGLAETTGTSLVDLIQGQPQHQRPFVVLGRERTDVFARPGSATGLGYPVRAIRQGSFFYIHNFKPDRWPCGNPELGLKDTDASPIKALIEQAGSGDSFYQLCYGLRPADELFDLASDPDCVVNLAQHTEHQERVSSMKQQLFSFLERQRDPRVLGQGDVFDNYPSTKASDDDRAKAKAKRMKKGK
jgi:N-sulfoglucosamine sulfohydrolase